MFMDNIGKLIKAINRDKGIKWNLVGVMYEKHLLDLVSPDGTKRRLVRYREIPGGVELVMGSNKKSVMIE